MADKASDAFTKTIGLLQLFALIIGVAGMFVVIGKRDQQLIHVSSDLDKLAGVVNDLAKTQASSSVVDASHTKALEDILRRLNNLEKGAS